MCRLCYGTQKFFFSLSTPVNTTTRCWRGKQFGKQKSHVPVSTLLGLRSCTIKCTEWKTEAHLPSRVATMRTLRTLLIKWWTHTHTLTAGSKVPSVSNQVLINSSIFKIQVSFFPPTLEKKYLKDETWLLLSHKDPTGKLLNCCFCWKTSWCAEQRTQRGQWRGEEVTALQKPAPLSTHSWY